MSTQRNKFRKVAIERIIGGSAKRRSRILDQMSLARWKKKYSFEGKKTQQERRIVVAILRFLPEFLKRYGIRPLRLTTADIHILEKKKIPAHEKKNFRSQSEGCYTFGERIYVLRQPAPLKLADSISHEIIHASSWHSLTLRGPHLTIRRLGFEVFSGTSPAIYFNRLNEAITTELVMQFDEFCFHRIPELRRAVRERQKTRRRHKESTVRRILSVYTRQLKSGNWECEICTYPYASERKKLRELIKIIYQKNRKQFASQEEVFSLFAQAALGGNLLPIARVIEKTFGKGSFRKLGKRLRIKK